MEADVSSQEQEEEEKEAVWLREQGHCKMRSVRDHPSQDPPLLQQKQAGELPGHGEELRVFSGEQVGSFGLLGRAEVGAGVDSPEGCYTITVRRHGLVCHGREGQRGDNQGVWPQKMVVSYLVLTGRLWPSRWSKSQEELPRECMSGSISRGSIADLRMLLQDWEMGRLVFASETSGLTVATCA